MPRLRPVVLMVLLAACDRGARVEQVEQAGRVEAPVAAIPNADSATALVDELTARYGTRPDSFELREGARLRVVYMSVGPAIPPSGRADTTTDTTAQQARYASAYRQAAWLWARYGQRAGIDTVSVVYATRPSNANDVSRRETFSFYPGQLRDTTRPPTLGR